MDFPAKAGRRTRLGPVLIPHDPSAPDIDHLKYFGDFEVEPGVTSLNGYQTGALVDFFGGVDPTSRRVNIGNSTFTIVRNRQALPRTDYNPLQLWLGLKPYLRPG